MSSSRRDSSPSPLATLRSLRNVAAIAWAVIVVRLGLTFFSLSAVRQRMLPDNPVTNPDPWAARRVGRAVKMVSRLIPFASCLTQAQACQIVLAQRSIYSDLFLGVRMADNGSLLAHAWVVVGGKLITGDGPDLKTFRVLAILGPSR